MNKTMIEKIHQANLEILLEVDRICRKHQIEYRLDADWRSASSGLYSMG